MRKILFLFLFISLCTIAYNQIITGIIQDLNTKKPVIFATIYFNGTFTGTHSDQNGYFEINISKNRSMPLIVSALGYYSVTISDLSPSTKYRIFLTPKVFELQEVVVSGKARLGSRIQRNLHLKTFKNGFLGKTLNARRCVITNEDDIIFSYDSLNDTLKAYALEPLQIVNKGLGYKISYYLDSYISSRDNFYLRYTGNGAFEEDNSTKKNQIQAFERRRETAYLGSRMHFIRSLWQDNIDSSGFAILDTAYKKINSKSLIFPGDSLVKYIKYQGRLLVSYYKKSPESSLTFMMDSVLLVKNGFFDGLGINWNGELARRRAGDELPYEYMTKSEHSPARRKK